MKELFENKKAIVVFCIFFQLGLCAAKLSTNMEPIDVSMWGLPEDGKYSTIYQLTETNFYSKVMNGLDAWVVVIFKEHLHYKWVRQAERLKASVWFGSIDYEKEEILAKKWASDLSEKELKAGIAFVFPYGKRKKVSSGSKDAQWPKQASKPIQVEKFLKIAIPDQIEKFSFLPDDMKNFQSWVIDSYYKSDPPKFPVLCITDESEPDVPISLLSISMYFSNFFSFGLVRESSVTRMLTHFKQVRPPQSYPHYLLLLGKEPSQEEMNKGSYGMSFNIFQFIKDKYGDPNTFLPVVKFLFTANEDFRDILPGRRSDESSVMTNMVQIKQSLRSRHKVVSKTTKPKNVKTEL